MTDSNHTARAHYPFSPSGAAMWTACHGSISAQHGRSDKPSAAAEFGTQCHEAAGDILEQGKDFDLATAHLTDEQTDLVRVYIDFVFDLIKDLEAEHGRISDFVETRFVSPHDEDFGGTADFAAVAGDKLVIADLKTGFVPVRLWTNSGRVNWQLGCYALLVYDNLPLRQREQIRDIELWVVQTRVHRDPIKITITVEDLEIFADEIYGHIAEIRTGDTERHGGEHCKYCRASGDCHAQRDFVMESARNDFAEPVSDLAFTDDELSRYSEEAEALEIYVNAIRERVQARLMKGAQISGWKLVERRVVDKWENPEAVAKLLKGEIPPDKLFRQTLRTPKQITAALDEAGSWVDVEDLHAKVSSGHTIARTDDKRPAVKKTVGDDFD